MPPYAKDYQSALQNPARVFAYPDLRSALFAVDSWGLPFAITGSRAIVFKVMIDEKDYALRCYVHSAGIACRERYIALSKVIMRRRLAGIFPAYRWRDDAMRLNGETWPVLQMEWIEGLNLDQHVGYLALASDSYALGRIAERWRDLIARLQQAGVAHGDLQHGNILLDQHGRLRLVDLDSVWVPEVADQPPPEIGHDNYRQPGRTVDEGWGQWADSFSALVIYLSLVALAADPELWPRFYNGDNLLFERRDFRAPFDTGIWKALSRIADPEIDRLGMILRDCCAPGWVATGSLAEMVSGSSR